ncbi:MAG: sorbosone dehydrogenase family protein [Lysobacterales bacterium]
MKMRILFSLMMVSSVAFGQVDLRVTEVATLGNIVDIRHAGDNSQRVFLVEKSGVIRILSNSNLVDRPFLDITERVGVSFNEQGLLSVAFAPDYPQSGRFYVFYTDNIGSTVLSRFLVSDDADIADAGTEEILLTVAQPERNHNGGRLVFGPDGLLYLSLGDGGGANDQFNHGQDPTTLLGTILRLDVSQPGGFRVPQDNPFVGDATGRDEIWAYGLRNPWRISFDDATGELFIADVGQDAIEEINVQSAASSGGENYGWPLFEGSGSGNPALTFPVFDYDHSDGSCSITGGEVYRGPDYPDLTGRYIYGDFCSGKIWSLQRTGNTWSNELLLDTGTLSNILTFGSDQRGNIYVSGSQNLAGRVFVISDGPVVEGTELPWDGSLSGTYTVSGLNDQGFFVTVGNNASGSFLFVAWFTFDAAGEPLWLVGVDNFESGQTAIELTMERVAGLPFLDFSDNRANRENYGPMIFSAPTCGQIAANYDFGTRGSGELDLSLLTNIEGRDCANP